MNRYFVIYIGLNPASPWGIAVERPTGARRVELMVLCRTEREAAQFSAQIQQSARVLGRQRAGKDRRSAIPA